MSQPKSTNWKTVSAILVGTILMLAVVIGVVYFSRTITNTGAIKTVNCAIFRDAAGTQPITAIDWGVLEADSAVNIIIYAKNTGNVPQNWTVTTSSWSPTNAPTYIACTADLKGATNTQPNAVIPIVLTTSIAADVMGITNYSFEIIITASG